MGLGARASYLQRSASAPGPAVLTAILLLASQPAIVACSSGGLTSSASASAEGSQPGGDAGQVHYRSQGEADASLARFERDHPQCQLWTNWQKMCSRTGHGGSTHCVEDPEMRVEASQPFCVRPDALPMSGGELSSYNRFCAGGDAPGAPRSDGRCRRFLRNRPFNGFHLSARRSPLCRRWVDANSRATVCVEGSGEPKCAAVAASMSNNVPLACAEVVKSPNCEPHREGVIEQSASGVTLSDLLLFTDWNPVNGLYCRGSRRP